MSTFYSKVIEPEYFIYYEVSVNSHLQSNTESVKRLIDVEREHISKTIETFEGHMGKSEEALGIDQTTL